MSKSIPVILDQGLVQDPSSYVDPHGRLYWFQGEPYRRIQAPMRDFYEGLFQSGVVRELETRYRLVESELVASPVEEGREDLWLKHRRVSRQTYCVEWTPSLLKEAALSTLRLALRLAEEDCLLQDAYPWNILFEGTEAVHVDFTSISPASEHLIWPAYEQFCAFFSRPLALAERGKGELARRLLLDNINGISGAQEWHYQGLAYKLSHPGKWVERLFYAGLKSFPAMKQKLNSAVEQSSICVSQQVRERFLHGLLRATERISFEVGSDVWGSYYDEIPSTVSRENKLQQVRSILHRFQPQSVLDLGANTGVFSLEAARLGAEVISVDSSETCMETLLSEAKKEGLSVLPLVSDVLCPTPAFGFMGKQYPPLMDRVRSDGVLCLGLMHHLHIAGRQSFDRIAELLAHVTSQFLVFEFVDVRDDNVERLHCNRDLNYSLEEVLGALSKYFSVETVLDSDRPTRKILVCLAKDH